ncbi:MAG: C1 domain-containing protein [Planctomycetota bacterium]
MRILLVASSAPLTCVYCHDALGAGPLDACKKCGTRYHKECAALAGSCALLGCDGTFETANAAIAADARLALVLRPVGAPTRERIAAVARVLRATEWDARHRIGSPVPQVLGYFTRNALAHATADLDAANVLAFAIDAAALAGPEQFVVKSVDAVERGLLLRDEKQREERLQPGATRVLVVARYVTDTGERREVAPDPSGEGTTSPYRKKNSLTTRTSHARVLYAFGGPRLYVFDEALIDDFRFLGARMTASSAMNFVTLASLLGDGADAVDRSLEKATGGHMRTMAITARHLSGKRTNRAWVDQTALLVYHAALESRSDLQGKGGPEKLSAP